MWKVGVRGRMKKDISYLECQNIKCTLKNSDLILWASVSKYGSWGFCNMT